MRHKLGVLLDALLGMWMTLVVAQYLAVLAGALWPSPVSDAPLDLRVGYWVIGGILLGASALFQLTRAPEVSGDR